MKGCIKKCWLALCLITVSHTACATVTYIYTDPQGTPLAEANAGGTITATFDYSPYGRRVLGNPTPGPGYTGHVEDPDTGLVYMQARYYDPVVGRFITVDPISLGSGGAFFFNRYSYVKNNPLTSTDPTGMQDCSDACMRMRALSDHFSNMSMGVSDENANAGMSAHGGGDWSHPGADPVFLTNQERGAYGIASFAAGQVASAMTEIEGYINEEIGGQPHSLGTSIGVLSMFTPAGPEVREASVGAKIIAETMRGKGNISSVFKLTADQALQAGLEFLGRDYMEIGRGVFRSSDGLRQFRIDAGSLRGAHAPGVPHVHFELYTPNGTRPVVNNHVPFSD